MAPGEQRKTGVVLRVGDDAGAGLDESTEDGALADVRLEFGGRSWLLLAQIAVAVGLVLVAILLLVDFRSWRLMGIAMADTGNGYAVGDVDVISGFTGVLVKHTGNPTWYPVPASAFTPAFPATTSRTNSSSRPM